MPSAAPLTGPPRRLRVSGGAGRPPVPGHRDHSAPHATRGRLRAPTEVPLTVVLALSPADAARVAELASKATHVVTVVVQDKTSGRR